MGLKNNLNEQSNDLSAVDDEIVWKYFRAKKCQGSLFQKYENYWALPWNSGWTNFEIWKIKINGTNKSSKKSNRFSASSKMPKIELPVFSGDPLRWQEFSDQFDISIHQNECISDIDRFN